jgi:hypothetical protein
MSLLPNVVVVTVGRSQIRPVATRARETNLTVVIRIVNIPTINETVHRVAVYLVIAIILNIPVTQVTIVEPGDRSSVPIIDVENNELECIKLWEAGPMDGPA